MNFKTHYSSNKGRESSVLIIYTGGTFGMAYNYEKKFLEPLSFDKITEYIPELAKFDSNIEIISFGLPIDSSHISPNDWKQLAWIIKEKYDLFDGFVIIHGTDTMAYTASALSFMFENLNKPVILTGAQLPIGYLRNDARENLITAIEIASKKNNGQALVPEVCIFFNNKLLRGNRATKVESTNFDAFMSPNYPELAEVGIHIKYNPSFIRQKPNAPFEIQTELSTHFSIIKIYPGLGKELFQHLLDAPKTKAIILETYGSGNAPLHKWFLEAIEKKIFKGIVFLNISQCLMGKVNQNRYETGKQLENMGVVSGGDMTMPCAIAKLMYILQNTKENNLISMKLCTSLRGEMSEMK